MAALARSRSFLGIAKESTKGTAVAATDYIPVRTINPLDNIKILQDQNWRGSMATDYGIIQGPIYSEIEIGGEVFPDTIGFPLLGTLGAYAKNGVAAPYTHNFAVLNNSNGTGQPYSYTLSDYYGGGSASTRQYPGCQFESIEFKFNTDGMLEYTAKAKGFASATAANPTPSFGTFTPVPVWDGAVTIGTSVVSMQEGAINIKRDVTPIFTVNNTQAPYQLFAGPVTVDGTFKFIMEDDTFLTRYLNNTSGAVSVDFAQASNGGQASQVKFTMSDCRFTVAKIDRGKDYVEVDVNFIAVANSTDKLSNGYSPINVQLQNNYDGTTKTYGAVVA